jgi:hypothetical protein
MGDKSDTYILLLILVAILAFLYFYQDKLFDKISEYRGNKYMSKPTTKKSKKKIYHTEDTESIKSFSTIYSENTNNSIQSNGSYCSLNSDDVNKLSDISDIQSVADSDMSIMKD